MRNDYFYNSGIGMFRSSPQGKLSAFNQPAAELLGFANPEQALLELGSSTLSLYVDQGERDKLIREFQNKQAAVGFEARFRRRDGSVIWVSLSGRLITWEDGRELLEGTIVDVTDKVTAREQLTAAYLEMERRVEQRTAELLNQKTLLEQLIDTLPNQVFWKNRNLEYMGCNRVFAEVTGMASPAEVAGKTDYDFNRDSTHAEHYRQWDARIMDSGEPVIDLEEKFHNADGGEGTVLTSKLPLRDEDGRVFGLLGICTDITARKRLEETLRESEAKFRTLTEMAAVGIVIVQDGRVCYSNRAASVFFDRSPKNMVGLSQEDLVTGEFRHLFSPEKFLANENRNKRHRFEVKAKSPKRGERWLDLTAGYMEYNGRPAVMFTALDIHDQKQATDQRIIRERLQAAIETAGAACHELNQPLQAVLMNLEMTLARGDSDDRTEQTLQSLLGEVRKMVEITQHLNRVTDYKTQKYLGRGRILDLRKSSGK